METNDLIAQSLHLYSKVKKLYSLVHAIVRYKLEQFYGIELNGGPIPAHLLGKVRIFMEPSV